MTILEDTKHDIEQRLRKAVQAGDANLAAWLLHTACAAERADALSSAFTFINRSEQFQCK